MKCKSFVKFAPARRVGSGEPYQRATKIFPRYNIKLGYFTPEPDMVECDGELEVHINAEQEGECACSSYAVLNIKYKCKKCGAEVFPELPQNSKEISHFVETSLRNLSEDIRDLVLTQKVEEEIKKQEENEEWRKEREKRFQKLTKELSKSKKKK